MNKKIDPAIFKPYDIWGVYPDPLSELAAYEIGRALALRVKAQGDNQIVVGSDMRLSGPALKKALFDGLVAEGLAVIDFGVVPIDAVYFAVSAKKYSAGVIITASHNPKEYNGFKLVLKNLKWLRAETLQEDIFKLPKKPAGPKGRVSQLEILPDYIKYILSFVDVTKIKPFKVVVDASNGLAGKIVPLLQAQLPIEVIPLNFDLDGNLPVHPANPLLPESQVQIIRAVAKTKADFGVIFDGDSDQVFFVDEKSRFIALDLRLLLLTKDLFNNDPGATVIINQIFSSLIPENIADWDSKLLRTKLDLINNVAGADQNSKQLVGEVLAKFSFRRKPYTYSGMIAWLLLLQLISQTDQKLSEIVVNYNKLVAVGNNNLESNL